MSIFSRIFKIFLTAVFTPLLLAGLLLFYYQNFAKKSVLETHYNLARTVSAGMEQYIDGLPARFVFAKELESKNKKPAEVMRALNAAIAQNPDFIMLALLDKNGLQSAAAGPRHILNETGEIDLREQKEMLSYLS